MKEDFPSSLIQIQELLEKNKKKDIKYCIPSLWEDPKSKTSVIEVNPYEFWIKQINKIKNIKRNLKDQNSSNWSDKAVVYNIFVRFTTAFDHDNNGELDLPLNKDGFRETGTFLKTIALLPYLKYLGINTLYCLPVTTIGQHGRKGDAGSPYAVKNPYKIDDLLSEPALGIGAEKEFKALVDAAHYLGMKLMLEFVFRTSARDSDWITERPDWFYWIKTSIKERKPGSSSSKDYGSPIFKEKDLEKIYASVEAKKFDNLIPPPENYLDMFTEPPAKKNIKWKKDRYIGKLKDKKEVYIPGAFADWPPDDIQPPWTDVTYLKMYDNNNFNYIAYNTIRMYDNKLADKKNENKQLWKKISDIIPFYQKNFNIDGVMIDMGHALPYKLKKEMVKKAKSNNKNFIFWDENFAISEQSVKEGYEAVIGHLCFDQPELEKHKAFLKKLTEKGVPILFFSTSESHNTPRAASRKGNIYFSKLSWFINNFIPGMPFISTGFEMCEDIPINTGLGFSQEDLKKYPVEVLPLFSTTRINWLRKSNILSWINKISTIRRRFQHIITDKRPESFTWIETSNEKVVAFQRNENKKPVLCVIANLDCEKNRKVTIKIKTRKKALQELVTDKKISLNNGKIHFTLNKGGVKLLLLK